MIYGWEREIARDVGFSEPGHIGYQKLNNLFPRSYCIMMILPYFSIHLYIFEAVLSSAMLIYPDRTYASSLLLSSILDLPHPRGLNVSTEPSSKHNGLDHARRP